MDVLTVISQMVGPLANWFSGISQNNLAKKQLDIQQEFSKQSWYQNLTGSAQNVVVAYQVQAAKQDQIDQRNKTTIWAVVVLVIVVIGLILIKKRKK